MEANVLYLQIIYTSLLAHILLLVKDLECVSLGYFQSSGHIVACLDCDPSSPTNFFGMTNILVSDRCLDCNRPCLPATHVE